MTKSTYAQSIFNEMPFQFLNNIDGKFLRNLRYFNHNLGNYNLNDLDFKVMKYLIIRSKKLKSNLEQVRKVWSEQYYTFLTSSDRLRNKLFLQHKSCVMTDVVQIVLINDDRNLKLKYIWKSTLEKLSHCLQLIMLYPSKGLQLGKNLLVSIRYFSHLSLGRSPQ